MKINIIYVSALLLLVIAAWPGVAVQCEEGKTLKGSVCVECTPCDTGYRQVTECTNRTDTRCAKICKEYEIQNANYECEINCSYCTRGQGRCDDSQKRCECVSGYFGDICERRIPSTSPPTTVATDTHQPEDDSGSKVVVIISIVCSIVAGIIVIITIVLCYVACSRRSSHQLTESSDESTGSFHSSNSINSRTMLTERSSQSPHRQTTTTTSSSLQRDTILPPPKSWNKFTLQ